MIDKAPVDYEIEARNGAPQGDLNASLRRKSVPR